ncbi:MAG: hypothetical protein KC776_18565 [Myxococcales bacterium]|nr:hypothetical protein [Myxococcales bacterium]MCB9579687.1 hypothetical protein [Polyangiaceae bacterium]
MPRVVALVVCALTVVVIYRYRHATSDVARLAAGLAGGACFLLLVSSGVLSFAPRGAMHILTSGALVGLAVHLLHQRTARQLHSGILALMAALLNLLPPSSPLVIPALVASAGMFTWVHLGRFRGRA